MDYTIPIWVICAFLVITSIRLIVISRKDRGALSSALARLILAGIYFSLDPLGWDQQTRAFLFRWAFLFVILIDELNFYSRVAFDPRNILYTRTKISGYYEVLKLWTQQLRH